MKRLILAFVLPLMLVLLGCEGSISPTAPDETLVAQQPATGVGAGTSGTSSVVAPGAAREFMLRARGQTSGPFGGPPLVGTAWVHVTGKPQMADVTVETTGAPGPNGLPTSHTFTFLIGDYFKTQDLATIDPPFEGPGEYALASTLTIVEGSGAFAGMTGTLQITKGRLTVDDELMATAEWHMKGRVQLGD